MMLINGLRLTESESRIWEQLFALAYHAAARATTTREAAVVVARDAANHGIEALRRVPE